MAKQTKDKITRETEVKYVTTYGHFCPYCGSTSISSDHPELDDAGVSVGVNCGECKKSWTDLYTLTGILEAE